MAPTKTDGGQAPSDKFLKKDAQAHGLGAENAPAHKEPKRPGEAPVASDSGLPGAGDVGTDDTGTKPKTEASTNVPGEASLKSATPGTAAPGPDMASG